MYATSAPTPPSTPEHEAAWSEFRHIRVTRVVEHSRTLPERDVGLLQPAHGSDPYNQSWKLIRVPADRIETRHYRWLNSEPGINIAGKTEDGKSYEVVIHASYVQWLCLFGCELYFEYDPTAPTKEDILVHGIREATQRAHARFLLNAVKKIRCRRYREYEEYCRDLARSNGLMIPLERALLIYDILESDPRVRRCFVRCLVFLGLNLLGYYNSCDALRLLAKDDADVLKPFRESQKNPLKAISKPKVPVIRLKGLESQTLSLVRGLLEFCGGMADCGQHTFEQEYTTRDNLNLYGILVGVSGTNRFADFDSKEVYNALSKSNVFDKDADIGSLDTVRWSMQMMEFLPIGFPEGYLDLPSQVLSGLGSAEVDLVGIYFEHTYYRSPSLRKPENNILLLLTWSSMVRDRPLRVLREWASSGDTMNLCQRLVGGFQNSQEPEQLALILAALLCHRRFLPYTSDDTVQPINCCYLSDLDILLSNKFLSNKRTVFERLGFSFLRVLTTLDDEYKDIIQLLAVALDKDPPLLDSFDGLTDQYVAERIKNGVPHFSARKEVKGLRLTETMLELSIDVGSPSQRINNISEDYWMIDFPGKSRENTRRISAAETTSLGEDFSLLDEDLETH